MRITKEYELTNENLSCLLEICEPVCYEKGEKKTVPLRIAMGNTVLYDGDGVRVEMTVDKEENAFLLTLVFWNLQADTRTICPCLSLVGTAFSVENIQNGGKDVTLEEGESVTCRFMLRI